MAPNTSSPVGTLAWAERRGGILSRRERISLLGDAARLQMRILPAQTRALLGRSNPRAFSVDPDRLRVPDTMIAREAEAALLGGLHASAAQPLSALLRLGDDPG